MTIRILIVDDHPVVRRGIKSLLSNYAGFEVVGEAAAVDSARMMIEVLTPDVILLDIRLAKESGLELLSHINLTASKVLILTSFDDDEHIRAALQGGAHGYILKSVSDELLCGAIRTVYQGGQVLSPQITEQVLNLAAESDSANLDETTFSDEELRMIRLLIAGTSNDQMAAELYMSVASVKRKLRHIFDKLKVQNRAQAAAVIVQRNLI
ncbi:MAG: response regulator transcription factor [Burkholderiales bacterium]|nr:response regulator transcription factor [Anaerolineae bacterium]